MPRALAPFTPDCGHTVTPDPASVGTGKATDPATGFTMCYPCADARERRAMQEADTYTVYISADARRITTWTGAVLGEVLTHVRGGRRVLTGEPMMRAVTARTPDGARWYGRCADGTDLITLRRDKN